MNRAIIAILLLALASTAAAQSKGTMQSTNNAGGKIVLRASPCVIDGKTIDSAREAYTVSSKGDVIDGCWVYQDGMVHAWWLVGPDVIRRVYPGDTFRLVE